MVYFGDRLVGGGAPCFVTFEVGPTHNGLESAKRLVRHAADSGADAIKFQMLNPDRLIADHHVPFTYSVLVDRDTGATEEIEEPLYELLKRRALNREEWRDLKEYSDSLGLAFFATAGFPEEIEFLIELGCHSIKIASADVNHKPLIRQAAATGVCLQIDTGNANLGEIEAAVDLILGEGNENIIIHHCPSGYPARLEGIKFSYHTHPKTDVLVSYCLLRPFAWKQHGCRGSGVGPSILWKKHLPKIEQRVLSNTSCQSSRKRPSRSLNSCAMFSGP